MTRTRFRASPPPATRRLTARRHGWSGQATVEFAMVLIIFLLLVFGTISGAQLVFTALSLNHAAQNAAREAIVVPMDVSRPLTSTLGLATVMTHTLSAV